MPFFLTKFGNSLNQIFYDIASGKNLERTNFKILQQVLRDGDTLVVESFSRLSRSTKELLELLEDFSCKNIRIISIKEDFDYSTPSGKMLVGMLSIIVQYERDLLLERQREGIALAKLKGKYKGRKPVKRPDNFGILLEKHLSSTPLSIYGAEEFRRDSGLKRATFYRILKKEKEARNLISKSKIIDSNL